MGWSLGGYLTPRAASEEHRLAALIADPGQWGIAWGFRDFAIKLGAAPQAVANLGEIDQSLLERMTDSSQTIASCAGASFSAATGCMA